MQSQVEMWQMISRIQFSAEKRDIMKFKQTINFMFVDLNHGTYLYKMVTQNLLRTRGKYDFWQLSI